MQTLHLMRLPLALTLLLVGCQTPIDDAPSEVPAFLAPDSPGPYAVGSRTDEVIDEVRGVTLRTESWFPAVPETGGDPVFAFSRARVDAEVDSSGAPFPVVVFSHGFSGARWQSLFLTEDLASRGYIVVAPDHPNNNLEDGASDDADVVALVAWNRPQDLRSVLDFVLSPPDWHPLVGIADGSRAGAMGHSYGAWTVLLSVGAVATGGLFGEESAAAPAPPWAFPDERVLAAVSLTPGGASSLDGGLGSISRPVLYVGAALDETMPYEEEARPLWAGSPTGASLLTLTHGGHFTPTDLCRILVSFGDGCGKGFVPAELIHPILQEAVAAFFGRHVQGDARFDPWLVPGRDWGPEAGLEGG